MNSIQALSANITKHHGPKTVRAYAPGRINLIGEHTDYNGGLVFPAAIDRGIMASVSANGTNTVRAVSLSMNKEFEFELDRVNEIAYNGWHNYVGGIVAQLEKQGLILEGFDLYIDGNIPIGSGLSSSAALEISMVLALNKLFEFGLDGNQIIEISQKSEHTYVGVKCGIMDQYASMFGKSNQAFVLDCEKMNSIYITIDLEEYELVLINSHIKHALADSEYNARRSLCERVAKTCNVSHICQINMEVLQSKKQDLSPDEFQKATYVLRENQRVMDAFQALRDKDLNTFGKLLFESHVGLQYEYEVSCPELDFLVEFARASGTVIGARMMGGGFGGCSLNVIRKGSSKFYEAIAKAYMKKFNKQLSFIPLQLDEGARLISNEK